MNLLRSIRTNVSLSSLLLMDGTIISSKDAETSSAGMTPCFEEVMRDNGDVAVSGAEQRANRQADGANTTT